MDINERMVLAMSTSQQEQIHKAFDLLQVQGKWDSFFDLIGGVEVDDRLPKNMLAVTIINGTCAGLLLKKKVIRLAEESLSFSTQKLVDILLKCCKEGDFTA